MEFLHKYIRQTYRQFCYKNCCTSIINKKKGFTLGEALITLTLVGVIASLTIPSLLTNIQSQNSVAGAQNAYKLGTNALLMVATNNNGSVQGLGSGNSFLRNAMESYLSTRVQCNNGAGHCFPATMSQYSGISSFSYTDTASLLLNKGMAFSFNYSDPNCNTALNGISGVCGTLIVDTNGQNPPNGWGKDIFGFWIQSNRLVPFGGPGDSTYQSINCNPALDGYGCAYAYIYGLTDASCSSTNSSNPCTENNTQHTQFVQVAGGCSTNCLPAGSCVPGWMPDGASSFTCQSSGFGCTPCTSSDVFYVATTDLNGTYTYSNALAACSALNNNGVTGWHLPTVNQLNSLYFQSNCYNIGTQTANNSCNATGSTVTGISTNAYWSSTGNDGYHGYDFIFSNGGSMAPNYYDEFASQVRCVRSA